MPDIHDLRRLALQRHKAATRKISRLKTTNGVMVSGSEYDPRTDYGHIRTASPKELRSLIRQLNKFNDRKTQFVPDAQNKPLPRAVWEQVKKAEQRYNSFVETYYSDFKDIHIGPTGQTVDQRMHAITPLHAHMGQRTTDNPYKQANRQSTSIYGESGARKLIAHLNKMATRKHINEALNAHRAGVMKMLDQVGNIELQQKVAKLTNKQWAVLWKYTPFASNIKNPYSHYKDSQAGNKSIANSESVQNDLNIAQEYVDWAIKPGNIKGTLK